MKLNIQLFAASCSVTITEVVGDAISNNSTYTIKATVTTGNSYNYGNAYVQGTYTGGASGTLTKQKFYINTNSSVSKSWTITVKHNDDGTLPTIKFNIDWYVTNNANGTISKSATPTTIPRASLISVEDGTLESSVPITLTIRNTDFTHDIWAVCGSETIEIANDIKDNTTWTPSILLTSQNTGGNTLNVTYYCKTKSNEIQVGEIQTTTAILTIPQNSTTKPSITVLDTDNNGLKQIYDAYVKTKSSIALIPNITTKFGASIRSITYIVKNGDTTIASGTGSEFSFVPNVNGTLNYSVVVVDSRNFSTTINGTLNVADYNSPSIAQFQCERNATNDKTINCYIDATSTNINNASKNTTTYKIYLDDELKNTWTGYSLNQQPYEITNTDEDTSHIIKLVVLDTLSSEVVRTENVSSSFTLINLSASGKSMAIGKASEAGEDEKLFEVAIPINVKNKFTTDDYTTKNTTNTWVPVWTDDGRLEHREIPLEYNESRFKDNTTNLNDATENGIYKCSSTSTNYPWISGSGIVEVVNDGTSIYQTVYDEDKIAHRKYNTSWTSWVYVQSSKVLFENENGATGNITFNETSRNFRDLEIIYFWNGGSILTFSSCKINEPDGKIAMLIGSYDNGSYLYHEVARYTINGTSLNRSNSARWRFATGSGATTRTNTTTTDQSLRIVKVVGYK